MGKKKMITQPAAFKNKDIIFATVFILFGIIVQLNEYELFSSQNLQILGSLLNYSIHKLLELFGFLFTSVAD